MQLVSISAETTKYLIGFGQKPSQKANFLMFIIMRKYKLPNIVVLYKWVGYVLMFICKMKSLFLFTLLCVFAFALKQNQAHHLESTKLSHFLANFQE